MTRDDVKKLFPDATDEQISNLLNQFNADVTKERKKAEQYKKDADMVSEYKAEIDKLKKASLTDEEQRELERKEKDDQILSLSQKLAEMENKSILAENGITGDDADKLLSSTKDGKLDIAVLSAVIKDREARAVAKKEEELMKDTPNPKGGNPDKSNSEDDASLDFAKSIGKSLTQGNSNTDILKNYM